MTQPLKVIVAGTQPVSIDAVRVQLGAGGITEVDVIRVGETGTLARKVIGHRPDAVVYDLYTLLEREPITNAAVQIRQHGLDPKLLVLTHIEDTAFAKELIGESGCGYVLKSDGPDELLNGVAETAAGRTYLSRKISVRIAKAAMAAEDEVLSHRELEVLRLTALGYTNHEMAEQLFLSVRTVESYRASILDKLGITRRHEMVREAMQRRLIELQPA